MSRFTFCRFQSGFFFTTYTATHHTAHKMGLFILSQSKKVIALANLSFFLFVLFFFANPNETRHFVFYCGWSFLSLSLNSPVRSKYMTKSLTPAPAPACFIITTCFWHSPACFYAPWLWKFPPAPQCGSASKCCFWRGRETLSPRPPQWLGDKDSEREREERAARKKK